MLRPATTGLATAFFRFYLLEALSGAPARPASVLTRVAAERLPFASGAFSRALQSLLERAAAIVAVRRSSKGPPPPNGPSEPEMLALLGAAARLSLAPATAPPG